MGLETNGDCRDCEYELEKPDRLVVRSRRKWSGISYSEKLKDPRWQKKRLEVFQRDNWACRDCGAESKSLHAHHCFYEKGEPWDTDLEYLLTVCFTCHEIRQSLENDGKRALGRVFARLVANGNDDLLTRFVTSMVWAADMDGPISIPEVRCAFDVDWMSDMRWFRYAEENPPFRKAYEKVTGNKVKWSKKRDA